MFFRRDKDLPAISIGITTFEHRFFQYFKPLLAAIRSADPDVEVIVAVNGEHNLLFSERYRTQMLAFLATVPRVYPIFFPMFRGVAKLWNTIIVHASEDHILLINDDLMISRSFVGDVRKYLKKLNYSSFTINKSWSHFLVSREEIDELGYFDERLLGIGEEDGDLEWRYFQKFRRKFANVFLRGVNNFAEESVQSYKPANISCHSGTKYSAFNREFMFQTKYRPDAKGYQGMFDFPHVVVDPCEQQYPYERFFRKYRSRL